MQVVHDQQQRPLSRHVLDDPVQGRRSGQWRIGVTRGLRRQQLFAAHPDVVERLRALAQLGELASAHVRRSPQATPREFARSIAAVADFGLREQEEPEAAGAASVQVLTRDAAGGLEADHVYIVGLTARVGGPARQTIPDALLEEELPLDDRVAVLSVAGHACDPQPADVNTSPAVTSLDVPVADADLRARVARTEPGERGSSPPAGSTPASATALR